MLAAWDHQCSPVAAHLANLCQSEALRLVGKAYSCIGLEGLARMLGCGKEEAGQSTGARPRGLWARFSLPVLPVLARQVGFKKLSMCLLLRSGECMP